MTIQDVITRLKSDIDDDQSLNVYFTDNQLINFGVRSIQYVNDRLKFCKKYEFLKLIPYFDAYALPVDYIAPIQMIDFKNQAVLPYAKYNPERLKSQLAINNLTTLAPRVNIWQADESRRKIYFDRVPDTTTGSKYTVHVDAYKNSTRPFVSIYHATATWFDPVYIELTYNDADKSICKVSVIESAYKGLGTATWSGTTVTLSTADSGYAVGDILEVAYDYGTTRIVESIQVKTWNSTTEFVAEDAPSHNRSIATKYHWTTRSVTTTTGLTALKKLYLSEENITNEYPRFETPDSCYLVDFGMLYYNQPYYSRQGSGTISFTTTAGTVDDSNTNGKLSVGDYLLINNEIRGITDVETDGDRSDVTISEAFTNTVHDSAYRYIKLSEEVPFPPDVLKAITVAMSYVFMRQSDHEKGNAYMTIANDMIESIRVSQEAGDINEMLSLKHSYDRNVQIGIPYRL
jgi:hypothetical protein